MATKTIRPERPLPETEERAWAIAGMPVLLVNTALMLASGLVLGLGIRDLVAGEGVRGTVLLVLGVLYLCALGPVLYLGLKVLRRNEALVLTLFGRYYGTLRGEGFYFVHPFVSPVGPPPAATTTGGVSAATGADKAKPVAIAPGVLSLTAATARTRTISLKTMTLNNDMQKINDRMGNPVIIGIVVIWRVVNTVKAVFSVENYMEYLSIQCDAALRDIVRNYPYDVPGDSSQLSLRGSSQEVASQLLATIQDKVAVAGLEVLEARITHLAYAPEIAAAMLQRQQASAMIDAREMIVEGAVGMVQMALAKLSAQGIIELDEERKAQMVSNLLVVLCGSRDAQPVVNTGTLY